MDDEKPYSKTLVIRKNAQGKQFKRELSQDSTGVREFFAWAVQIFRVVYENKVVFADEMDRFLIQSCQTVLLRILTVWSTEGSLYFLHIMYYT